MSMTREEAIALLNEQYETCKRIYDCSADQRKSYPNVPQFMEALGMALSALRPVSREKVEKLFPGCPKCRTCNSCAFRYIEPGEEPCLRCNNDTYSNYKAEPSRIFCSTCGSPLTDEAVGITLKRLEALKDGSTTD